jgi:hypothetical protein
VAVVAVFGVFLPWRKGLEFLDPVIIAAYSCLGLLFAAPAAAQAFSANPPHSMKPALASLVMAVLYGEIMMATILLAAFMTVYLTHLTGPMFAPDWRTLAFSSALGLTASLALAAIAAWITLRFSATTARAALRGIFLGLLVVFFFRSQWLPEVAAAGAAVCLAIAAVMLLSIRSVVGRAR